MGKIKLGKPPIVERWVSFDFEPNPSKTAWDGKLASQLADSLSVEFPGRDHIWEQQFRVTHAGPGSPVQPEFLVRLDCVRCANAMSTELFQIRDDQIAYNRLRGKEDWPGFNEFLDRALYLLTAYRRVFQPSRIIAAVLHEVDIIEIPLTSDGLIQLDEYFSLIKDLPEKPFGLIQAFASQYVTIAPHDREPFTISLQQIPVAPEAKALQFRVEWDKKCVSLDFSTDESIRSGLNTNHDFMLNCFLEAFSTTKCWELFEPIGA
ncbi:MAG: TIGR04255 family protein [Planctomycetota bacterium]